MILLLGDLKFNSNKREHLWMAFPASLIREPDLIWKKITKTPFNPFL